MREVPTMTNPYGTPAPYPPPPMPPRRPKRPIWPWFLGGGVVLFGLLVFVVFIAAIATAPNPRTGVSDTSQAPGDSSTPPGQLNESGFKPMKIGDEASFGPNNGADPIVKFTITKITVDPKCGPYMRRPAGKHTLLVDMNVETLAFPDQTTGIQIAGTLNPLSFQTRDPGGITHSGSIGTCVGTTKPLPMTYAPNSRYSGQIEVEADDAKGSLLLARSFSNGSGWDWPY